MRTVLFIQLVDKKEFRPTNVLYGGAFKLEQYYRKQFPEIRAEELPDVTKALESQEGVNLKSWDILEIFDDNPCGLISLGPQFRKAISALKSGKHMIPHRATRHWKDRIGFMYM